MLSITKPKLDSIFETLNSLKNASFNYFEIKGTLDHETREEFLIDPKFKDYNVDSYRIKLGEGEAVYTKAVLAFKGWRQFEVGWADAIAPDLNLIEGTDVAIVAKTLGLWSLSVCRIVYTVDGNSPDGTKKKFGFASGTLPIHVERGEERFLIEWNLKTNEVFYEILSFSVPQAWFSSLAYPISRYYQDLFGVTSGQAMLQAIENPSGAVQFV